MGAPKTTRGAMVDPRVSPSHRRPMETCVPTCTIRHQRYAEATRFVPRRSAIQSHPTPPSLADGGATLLPPRLPSIGTCSRRRRAPPQPVGRRTSCSRRGNALPQRIRDDGLDYATRRAIEHCTLMRRPVRFHSQLPSAADGVYSVRALKRSDLVLGFGRKSSPSNQGGLPDGLVNRMGWPRTYPGL